MANYSTYFNLLRDRMDVLRIYAVIMYIVLCGLVIMHHVCVRSCVRGKQITFTNTCTYNKYCIWLFKNFYKLVSWMTNQLFGKQMSLDKDDKNYSILTFNGRQHKIKNRCQLINILVWMFLSEICVISTLIALGVIKSKYDITITNTCWPGLHTGTDCFSIDIDKLNFTCGEIEADIPPVNCNEWDNTNPVVCFKRKYFPLTVVLALLTALIKLILPILMSIIGVIMNIITYCFLRCDFIKRYCFLQCNACYMTSIVHLFFVMPYMAIIIVYATDKYHWIRYLESKGYDYIAELIVGTGVIIQELATFPWADLRQIRIDEDDKIFSDDQSNYGTFNNTPSSVEARLVS